MAKISLSSLLMPSSASSRNIIRDLWDRLHGLPGGKLIFSRLVGEAAPYTVDQFKRVDHLFV